MLSAVANRLASNINSNCLVLSAIHKSSIHLTSRLQEKTAGKYKKTKKNDAPISYERFIIPPFIGHKKALNSFNTSSLDMGKRAAETAQEEIFVRKFMHGAWPKLLASDVIIKRRGNQIFLSYIVTRSVNPMRMYFLIGYTEEVLSYLLKCPVKCEVQTVPDDDTMTYTYV